MAELMLARICLFCVFTWLARGQSCPQEVSDVIQACVRPVAQFAETLGVDVKEAGLGADRLMPSMGSHVFRQLCSKITTFSTCVRKARRQCPTHITLTLINASYGYLCTDGYNVFVKNADCLMRLDQVDTVRACHERTMGAIKNSSADTKAPMAQKLVRMCDSLNYFAACVEGPVQSECGTASWSVIARVLHDTTKTLMPACKFNTPVPEQRIAAEDQLDSPQPGGQQHPKSKTKQGSTKDKSRANGKQTSVPRTAAAASESPGLRPGGTVVVALVVLSALWRRPTV